MICAGDQLGCSWRSSVATPETCGAAIEVPENFTPWFPVPASVDWMSKPGAEMSGFRSLVSRAGPSEVKSVIASVNCGNSDSSSLSVTVVGTVLKLSLPASGLIVAARASESPVEIIATGTVMLLPSPPMPICDGRPPKPFQSTTALAPAACALATLSSAKQSPVVDEALKISAILPANGVPPIGSQSSRSGPIGFTGSAGGSNSRASTISFVRLPESAGPHSWITIRPPSGSAVAGLSTVSRRALN